MTSFVMIMPLFARRFSEFGAGVEALGASAMAYALASTLAAPWMGTLADRFGRRPVVLLSLAVYVLAFAGYLLASTALGFILLRGLAGVFTAGLVPAATGIVADLAPTDRRAQWIGIVSGGAAVGWIAGPLLGGVFYDRWGTVVPFMISILLALAAFTLAFLAVPETRTGRRRSVGAVKPGRLTFRPGHLQAFLHALRAALRPLLPALAVLLGIYFAIMFAWAFIEPRFMFYAIDDLRWSASLLGLVMSAYGVAMVLGEFSLSKLSDRLGRKPVIMLGLALFAAQFLGLAFSRNYGLIALSFVVAGLGNALLDPALSAHLLDIAPPEHRARILGVKSTAGSLGNILGPALVVLVMPFLDAQGIFLIAAGVVFLVTLVCLPVRMGPQPSTAGLRYPTAEAQAD